MLNSLITKDNFNTKNLKAIKIIIVSIYIGGLVLERRMKNARISGGIKMEGISNAKIY